MYLSPIDLLTIAKENLEIQLEIHNTENINNNPYMDILENGIKEYSHAISAIESKKLNDKFLPLKDMKRCEYCHKLFNYGKTYLDHVRSHYQH